MKYIVFCVLVALLCISAAALATKAVNRKRSLSRTARALVCILFTFCFLLGAGSGYLAFYYRADPAVQQYLQDSGSVTVQQTINGSLFDGPGKEKAMVFYPGAKVDSAAYAPMLSHLAARGIDVFLVRMPMHLAFLNPDAAAELMAAYDYPQWILAGHSLGGVMAGRFAASHPKNVQGLVLLAAYPTQDISPSIKLLSIYGTNDAHMNKSAYAASKAHWPQDARELVLQGGNHAQFGYYGMQKYDGVATLPAPDQQQQTVDAIIESFGSGTSLPHMTLPD